eukprot:12083561-Heterocapsa_arctica.AAC.1
MFCNAIASSNFALHAPDPPHRQRHHVLDRRPPRARISLRDHFRPEKFIPQLDSWTYRCCPTFCLTH